MSAIVTEKVVPTGTLRQVPLKDIVIGERFRKDFSDDQTFVESVREKGILQPITVDKNLQLLAGERRFRAAQQVGLEKIPALVRPVEDELDAREIELIENIFRKDFTWVEQTLLIAEIDRLYRSKNQDWNIRKTAQVIDQSKSGVHNALEMAKALEIMPELAKQEKSSDAFKLYKAAQETLYLSELSRRRNEELARHVEQAMGEQAQATQEGRPPPKYSPEMVVRLRTADADYRIGDIFEALETLPENGQIHLIECDPPYGIDLPELREGDHDSQGVAIQSYEEIPSKEYPDFLTRLTKGLYRVAHPNAWMIFWFASKQQTLVRETLLSSGWKIDEVPAIWCKPNGQTMQPEFLLSRQYEPFFVCHKGRPYINERGRANVFNFPLVNPLVKYHPTERPTNLLGSILETFGVIGQTVFIPFLGSGATLRACYQRNRKGFGYDKNPEYKDKFMLAVENDAKAIIGKESQFDLHANEQPT